MPKSEECSSKNGFEPDLGKKIIRDDLEQGHSKPVPNPFQIGHLELVIWTFGPKMNYDSYPVAN